MAQFAGSGETRETGTDDDDVGSSGRGGGFSHDKAFLVVIAEPVSGVDEELGGGFDDGPPGLCAFVEGRRRAWLQVEGVTAKDFNVQVTLDDVDGFIRLNEQIERFRSFLRGDMPEPGGEGGAVSVPRAAYPKHSLSQTVNTLFGAARLADVNGYSHAGYGTGREALLAATVHAVARKGLRGLTYRAVADLAGVNNTLVAHHLEWSVNQSVGQSGLESLPSTEDEFCRSIMELIRENPDMQTFQYEMILEARRRPELAGAVRRLYESYIAALSKGLRNLGISDDYAVAQTAFAALDGLVLQLIAGADPGDVERAIRYLWSALLKPVGAGLPGHSPCSA